MNSIDLAAALVLAQTLSGEAHGRSGTSALSIPLPKYQPGQLDEPEQSERAKSASSSSSSRAHPAQSHSVPPDPVSRVTPTRPSSKRERFTRATRATRPSWPRRARGAPGARASSGASSWTPPSTTRGRPCPSWCTRGPRGSSRAPRCGRGGRRRQFRGLDDDDDDDDEMGAGRTATTP